jgi:single-strand DNA-binding protein
MNNTYVTVTGNLTQDPDQRFGNQNGLPFTVFRLAHNRHRFDRENDRWIQVGTDFVEVVAFRTLGLNASESLAKGDPVVVLGKLKLRDWDNGERSGTTVQIEADAIGFDFTFGQAKFKRVRRPQVPGADPTEDPEVTAALESLGEGPDAAPAEPEAAPESAGWQPVDSDAGDAAEGPMPSEELVG